MSEPSDPVQLVGRTADEGVLEDNGESLPESMGRPPLFRVSRSRGKIVAVGATLTGVTLIGGIALTVLGAIEGISGGFGALAWIALVIGVIMVSTHWGWVHVAEFSANAVVARANSEVERERFRWLHTLEPYTRYEVCTDVEDDGSLTIATVSHRPVATTPGHFSFVRELIDPERHASDEPAARIAERAEQRRAASEALAQQINTNLRDPPLTE